MKKTDIKPVDALYYNRKFVHIFAGGVITLFVPLYSSQWYPLMAGIILTSITFISHKKGRSMYWFQTDKNRNDVTFCLMWGLSIFILWSLLQNPFIAILPAAFMSFGDGITGIARNVIYNKRFKHPIGNLFMGIVCISIGLTFGGLGGIPLGGILAGLLASIVERYEFGAVDDNILITTISSIFLYIYVLGSKLIVFPF